MDLVAVKRRYILLAVPVQLVRETDESFEVSPGSDFDNLVIGHNCKFLRLTCKDTKKPWYSGYFFSRGVEFIVTGDQSTLPSSPTWMRTR
jgi:hypothetical protein